MCDAGESGEDVGDDEGVHQKALGELKRDAGSIRGARPPDDFVNFEVVVGGEEGNGGV